ncbi:hypothetical protein V1477_004159 [Vespula maculifrons]|uniref:Uncharacterized protein n=1 Tax=Vespula maculifrons TaxID=7453 RepID=A0ABD2CQT5_VESMC
MLTENTRRRALKRPKEASTLSPSSTVAFEIELFIRRSRAILERAIVKSESRLMDLKCSRVGIGDSVSVSGGDDDGGALDSTIRIRPKLMRE